MPALAKQQPFIIHALDQLYDDQTARDHAIAARIRLEAQGKVCGDCEHYASEQCWRWDSVSENRPLNVLRPTAVACTTWEKRK